MLENCHHWEGQVVDGRFPLMQYLGGGERSAVFATVTADKTAPTAAIKLVPADPDDAADQVARWEAAARLSHRHLIRLFQAGCCQLGEAELLYVVMERADEDLSQVLPQRALSAAEVVDLLEPALDALSYVHARGLVHGHVRPSNLLATGHELKLSSDRIGPAGESRRHPGELDVYDAPETGGAGIAPAADIWSLGVTLVEALTQRPSARPPELPPPFRDILRGCLERDAGRRWTVAQIQARLRPAGAQRGTRWRYGAIAAAVIVGAAIVAGPNLVHRQRLQSASEAGQPPAAVAAPSVEASQPERTPAAAAPVPSPPAEQARASGGVLHQVLPDLLPRAQNSIRGKVKVSVKIHVDPSGRVADAELASRGPSRYFAGKALEAAREWTFTPPVPREWLLHFEFDRGGTKVRPVPVGR
jgi:TonB family protein